MGCLSWAAGTSEAGVGGCSFACRGGCGAARGASLLCGERQECTLRSVGLCTSSCSAGNRCRSAGAAGCSLQAEFSEEYKCQRCSSKGPKSVGVLPRFSCPPCALSPGLDTSPLRELSLHVRQSGCQTAASRGCSGRCGGSESTAQHMRLHSHPVPGGLSTRLRNWAASKVCVGVVSSRLAPSEDPCP